jgi:hypothetical protein
VSNDGRGTARGLHVRLASIERWEDGAWKRERSELDARELNWGNTPSGESIDIPPHSSRPLDLISVHPRPESPGKAAMRLEIARDRVGPPTSGGDIFYDPGSWRIGLVLDGDNIEVMRRYVAVGFSADFWDPEGGRLWTHTARIAGPTSKAPDTPVITPTVDMLLEEALREDAEANDA